MSNKKMIIFDFDGILFETDIYHFLSWKKVFQRLSIFLDTRHIETLKGKSRVESLEFLESKFRLELREDEKNEFLHQHEEYYRNYIKETTRYDLAPNLLHLINLLKSKGFNISILTKSKFAIDILKEVGYYDLFNYIPSKEVLTDLSLREHSTEELLIHVVKEMGCQLYDTYLITNSANIVNVASEMLIRTILISGVKKECNSLYKFNYVSEIEPEEFIKLFLEE